MVVCKDSALLTVSVEKKYRCLRLRNTHSRTVDLPVIYSLPIEEKNGLLGQSFAFERQ